MANEQILSKDIGRYQQNPAIYQEEIDASVRSLPIQESIKNMIVGVSRKPKRPNGKALITNESDMLDYIGDRDLMLENNGSFFQYTVKKMLEAGSVYTVSLLLTDDNRDITKYSNISMQSSIDNSDVLNMPYSRIYNRQGFWERSEESFLDFVNLDAPEYDRLLSITNINEKDVTVFIYKSSVDNFNVTCENWYGGKEKVPTFLNSQDWVSDYLVSVLILAGNWTDYTTLSVDSKWSKYFNTKGLIKTNVEDFTKESNVTVLGFYDASLIPYFKDVQGTDMYIETKINADTDKHGIFVSYNKELLINSNYPTGKVDLLGSNLVGSDKTNIKFMSYDDSILENISYTQKELDSLSNTFGNYNTDLTTDYIGGIDYRTATNSNWYVHDTYVNGSINAFSKVSVVATNTLHIDNVTNFVENLQVYINEPDSNGVLKINTPYYLKSNPVGNSIVLSTIPGGAEITGYGTLSANANLQSLSYNLNVGDNAYFNCGGVKTNLFGGSLSGGIDNRLFLQPLAVMNTGQTNNRYDVIYLNKNSNNINVLKGVETTVTDSLKPAFNFNQQDTIILGYFKHQFLSATTTISSTYYPVTITNNTTKYNVLTLTGYTGSNFVELTFLNSIGSVTVPTNEYERMRLIKHFDELDINLSQNKGVIINNTTGEKIYITSVQTIEQTPTSNAFIRMYVSSTANLINSNNVLIYFIDDEFVLIDTCQALTTSTLPVSISNKGVIGLYSNLYQNFYNGEINSKDYFYINNDESTTKIYLKMWKDTNLNIEFYDGVDFISPYQISNWNGLYTNILKVYSNKSSYKQSIDIDSYVGVDLQHVFEIKMDKVRYAEVKLDTLLETYYDETLYEIGGELEGAYPKKLTRVISVTIDPNNTNLKVVRTSEPIRLTSLGSSKYQTMMYPSIDTYISQYKGLLLKGFKIHVDSLPNGTEERQNQILNMVGKTTNLFAAMTDKTKISWRYLVDTFGLGLTNNSKYQLVDICSKKLNCFAFINMPSVRMFKKSANPSFVTEDGSLNTLFIKQGGDRDKNPNFLYTYANVEGRNRGGYCFPYIKDIYNGIPKNVPPAATVAREYMRKFNSTFAGVKPWTLVFGVEQGLISGLAGTEMEFTEQDLINLNTMGANIINYNEIRKVFYMHTENTAQVFPYSSLSDIHSIEVLIELENELYDMLLSYQGKFNTPEIRTEIKTKADKICKRYFEESALYNYKNTCDVTNNTDEIIDFNIGVLTTEVELIKGMKSIVNKIIIRQKGGIQSSGFGG